MIDGGAEEIDMNEEKVVVFTSFEDFGNMQRKLDELGLEATSASLQRMPVVTKTLTLDEAGKILLMIEKFEDDDDISIVYHNMELTDELAEALNNNGE